MMHPIEPPASSLWGWSNLVSVVTNRQQATATLGLLSFLQNTIAQPPEWWAAADLPDLTAVEWDNLQNMPDRGDATLRALKYIALDPAKRADILLSLDVHIAYLRAQFDLSEVGGQS